MNSLSDLNNHSKKAVAYTDPGTYSIAWTATGANIGGKQHTIYTHMPPQSGNALLVTANTVSMIVPIDFTTLSSVTNNVVATYSLYQTSVPGTYPTDYLLGNIFIPNTLPAGTTVTRSGDISIDGSNYRNTVTISGITSVDAWSAIRLPVMDIAGTRTGVISPTVAGNIFFTYANGTTTSFTFRNVLTENSNLKISNASPITYAVNQPKTLTAYPQIWANIISANVYVTPSISSGISKITSAGVGGTTGGTTFYDQYSKTLTITGNGTQINTHLASLTVTPAIDSQSDIFLNYTLRDRTTSGSGFNSNVSQTSTTSSNVAIHSINQLFTANAFTLARTFDENGYGLLFPNRVPVVSNVGTGNYTISLTLSSDSGIIGLGESFTTPVGWTQANLNYSYTGNLTNTNTTLSNLRHFARPGGALKPTVTYTQQYNGTTQFTTTFKLNGQANAKIVGGTTRYNAYEEQVITDVDTAEFYPSVFSNYAVMYRGIHGGIDNNAVYFTGPNSNWHTISNAVIYRQFTPAANLSAHISNLSEARTANIRLGPDYTNDIAIEQILGIESYVTGSSLGGGSQYRAFKPISISPTSEFSLTEAYQIPWDWQVPLDIQVTDYDTGSAIYTANIRQIDSLSNPVGYPGWLVFRNNANVNYGNITVSGTKSNINAILANISYYRPINVYEPYYIDNLGVGRYGYQLQYTQSKVSGNITSATYTGNIVVNTDLNSARSTVTLPATATLGLVTNTYITGTVISDPITSEANVTVGNIGKTYSFSLTQSNPIGYFWLNGSNVGTSFTTYGNITNINATIANIGFDCNTTTIGATTTFTSNVVRQIIGTGNVTHPQYGNTVIASNTCVATTALQNIGDPMGGGYYAGKYSMSANASATHYLVVAPRLITGVTSDWSAGNIAWITPPDNYNNLVTTDYDGATNTTTLASNTAISYGAAKYCNDFVLDKYNDWYLPSYYELEIAYYNLKPSNSANDIVWGENAYAVPPRFSPSNYTSSNPGQTTSANFKLGAGGNGIGLFVAGSGRYYYQYYCTSTTWGSPNTTNGPVLIDFLDGTRYASYTRINMSGQANVAIRPMRKISI